MRRIFAPVGRVLAPAGSWLARRSKLQLGVMWLVSIVLIGAVLMKKQDLLLSIRPGDTITAEFASRYKVAGVVSKVEVAGVKVGQITRVRPLDGGGAAVEMKLDKGTLDALGSAPKAAIRPATFLGGPGLSAYVELTPGGAPGRFDGDRIPQDRTHVPVEFDRVNEVLQDTARHGLQTTVAGLDTALADGGKEALGAVLADAPPALAPTGRVLEAMGGTAEGDLHRLVVQLSRAAAVLTATDGEIESVVDDLATVAGTLADRAPELERSIATMPATLRQARAGLSALDGTLARLQATAPGARPSVARLTELLGKLPPVLRKATPLLADLRPVVADLKPALDDLAPTAGLLRQLLGDLEDPVLGRLRDQIVPAVLAPYTGTGRDTRLYEELGHFLAGFDGVSSFVNPEGSQLNFYIGLNGDSISLGGTSTGPANPGSGPMFRSVE
ncbi:MAG: MlaD family protein [Actinomycetota bacterium]|jgi:phospholipid/cholesterol/gamma-HCH transport system substrate-binding protein